MKAVVYDRPSSRLVFREAEKPEPRKDEVLVRIHAAGLNAADYRSLRMGLIPKSGIFGVDLAGRVEAVGPAATRFAVGDDVFGDISACGSGALAEYAVVSERAFAAKPARLSYETAAALPMSAVTALQGLRDAGGIQANEKVLLYGAGGGVGTFAVQLAKWFGARVTAVCGSGNSELLKSLGSDEVFDYRERDVPEAPGGYDLILALNGSRPLGAYTRLLSPRGRCVVVGGALPQVIKALLFGPFISIGGRKVKMLAAKPDVRDLEFVGGLAEEGAIAPVIDRVCELREAPEALRYLGEGHARGKVIVKVTD